MSSLLLPRRADSFTALYVSSGSLHIWNSYQPPRSLSTVGPATTAHTPGRLLASLVLALHGLRASASSTMLSMMRHGRPTLLSLVLSPTLGRQKTLPSSLFLPIALSWPREITFTLTNLNPVVKTLLQPSPLKALSLCLVDTSLLEILQA